MTGAGEPPAGPGRIQEVADGVLVGWAVPGDAGTDGLRLGAVDARRLDGFGPERRAAFLTGRTLLVRLLGERSGDATADTGPCPHCGGAHGPVVVHGDLARASVAYAPGLVVAAVGSVARLGVDVVDGRPGPRWDDLGRLLRVAPGLAGRRWAQVEAVLKADGRGLRVDPAEVLFRGSAAWVDGPVRYRLQDVEAPEPYLVSVAWAGRPAGGAWGVRAGRARRRPAVRRS